MFAQVNQLSSLFVFFKDPKKYKMTEIFRLKPQIESNMFKSRAKLKSVYLSCNKSGVELSLTPVAQIYGAEQPRDGPGTQVSDAPKPIVPRGIDPKNLAILVW
jgi:hypothetical protein